MHSSGIIQFLQLARIENAMLPVLAFLIGYGFLGNANTTFVNYSLVAIVAISIYATLQNDLIDKDVDVTNKRQSAYIDGTFSRTFIHRICLYLLFLAVISIILSQSFLLGIGVTITLLLSFAYNNKPLQLSRRPISSIIVLSLVLGFIPTVLGLGSDLLVTLVGSMVVLGVGLQRFSLSLLKDYKDYIGDKKYHKNTFLIVFGPKITKINSIIFSIFGYTFLLGAFMFQFNAHTLFIPFIAFAIINVLVRFKLSSDNSKSNNIFKKSQKLNVCLELGLVACIFIL